MKIYAGSTYWNQTENPAFQFDKLTEDIHSSVLIVGAGMSGTLSAYVLSAQGFSVTVIEKGEVGCGSSSANTGLLQYSSDKTISQLAEEIGEEKAVLFYQMCLEAMDQLNHLAKQLPEETGYRLKDSINYASEEKDRSLLQNDYELCRKHDFPAEFLDRDELKSRYGIDKAAALRTWHDAEVNPYKFIQALTRKNVEQGVRYFEHTEADLEQAEAGKLLTRDGKKITYDHLILATGYMHVYPLIEDKCIKSRTYAFASEPVKGKLWDDQVMIWETKRPYLYLRTTPDNRIIAGGLDEEINAVVTDDEKINQKNSRVAAQIEELFPHLSIEIADAWNALFYGSRDGLPFIGADPEDSTKYYLLGYEGNGTCYSMAGAMILADLLKGKENPYADLLRLDR